MLSRKRRSAPTGCGSSRISTTGELRSARSRADSDIRRPLSLDDSKPIGTGIASEVSSRSASITPESDGGGGAASGTDVSVRGAAFARAGRLACGLALTGVGFGLTFAFAFRLGAACLGAALAGFLADFFAAAFLAGFLAVRAIANN